MGLVPAPVFCILRTLVFFSNSLSDVAGECTDSKVKTDLGSNSASAAYLAAYL